MLIVILHSSECICKTLWHLWYIARSLYLNIVHSSCCRVMSTSQVLACIILSLLSRYRQTRHTVATCSLLHGSTCFRMCRGKWQHCTLFVLSVIIIFIFFVLTTHQILRNRMQRLLCSEHCSISRNVIFFWFVCLSFEIISLYFDNIFAFSVTLLTLKYTTKKIANKFDVVK